MNLIGRVTGNAIVTEAKNGRSVVEFNIAINDGYRPKGSDEWKDRTTFVRCSYWRNTVLANKLTKGTLVELTGYISVSAWLNVKGEAKGALNLQVNTIKIHSKGTTTVAEPEIVSIQQEDATENLPF